MSELKESGINWIGKIPKDWNCTRIGSLYNLRTTKVSDKDYPPLSVTKRGVVPQLENVAKTNDNDNRKLVKKGDFVINSRSDRRNSCGISKFEGSVSLINSVLKPSSIMNPEYYKWVFETDEFADDFYANGHGIVDDLWTTTWLDMKKMMLPVPSLLEQKNIAHYLDEKCAEMDLLKIQIEEQIEILKQYKQSIITNVVTKGLNPHVDKIDSGINSIGVIPSNWKVTRIGFISWVRARLGWKGLKAEEYVEEGYPFLSAFNIQNDKIIWDELNYITEFRFNESPEIMLSKNDVLLLKDGAGIGKTGFVNELPLGNTTVNSSLCVITTNSQIKGKFLYYYLISSVFKNFIKLKINGMGVPHLTQEEIKKSKIIVPPLEEQDEIINYLDNKCYEIDMILNDKEKQLETLEEYKKSLIYEYVTGKKRSKMLENKELCFYDNDKCTIIIDSYSKLIEQIKYLMRERKQSEEYLNAFWIVICNVYEGLRVYSSRHKVGQIMKENERIIFTKFLNSLKEFI